GGGVGRAMERGGGAIWGSPSHRAGVAGFRRSLCHAAGKPLSDPACRAGCAIGRGCRACRRDTPSFGMRFVPPKLTFLRENPICVPRKLRTRELGTNEKLALTRELLPGPGISQVRLGAMPRPANGKKDWLAGAGNFV